MATHKILHFTELDTQALDDFFVTMAHRPGNQSDQKITPGSLNLYANLLTTLYRQGQRYSELAIPEPHSAMEHVNPKKKLGSWPCTPDEIAVPLLSSALRLIETPADDVITLCQSAQAATDATLHDGSHIRTVHANALAAVSDFRFSTLPGEDKPWQPHPVTSITRIKSLVNRIEDAAFVLLSYFVGMRAGEILSLQAGCVQPRRYRARLIQRTASTSPAESSRPVPPLQAIPIAGSPPPALPAQSTSWNAFPNRFVLAPAAPTYGSLVEHTSCASTQTQSLCRQSPP